MGYIDKKFTIVSRMMSDSKLKSFFATVITPLISTLAVSFIQSFTLSFTDYGIPAALAGNVDLLATRLYNEMLGSLPDFNTGSAVSIIMLLPSVASIILISVLNKYNIRYNKISVMELTKNRVRDIIFGMLSAIMILCIFSVFTVIFLVPFVEQWPYRMNFTTKHITDIFSDSSLMSVYKNSLLVALATASLGSLIVYMIFRNLEVLGVSSVSAAIKVGDTVADIKEGTNAGMISVGIIEGSSVMGYTETEYEAFSSERKELECQRVRQVYEACGADHVISNISELIPLIEKIEE